MKTNETKTALAARAVKAVAGLAIHNGRHSRDSRRNFEQYAPYSLERSTRADYWRFIDREDERLKLGAYYLPNLPPAEDGMWMNSYENARVLIEYAGDGAGWYGFDTYAASLARIVALAPDDKTAVWLARALIHAFTGDKAARLNDFESVAANWIRFAASLKSTSAAA